MERMVVREQTDRSRVSLLTAPSGPECASARVLNSIQEKNGLV
jgi:hypothetical protein